MRLLAGIALLVAAPVGAADVVSVSLIDADLDLPIAAFDPLLDGTVINLADLSTRNLNLRADVDAPVGSVRFAYDGNPDFRTESVAPYAFAGDTAGDYNPWTPAVGDHELTATPYNGAGGGGGVAGASVFIRFTVVDQAGNLPPTADAGPDHYLTPPVSRLIIDGSGRDLDGVVAGYEWQQVSGPAVTLTGTDGEDLTVDGLSEASYVFRLTVTDDEAATGSDEVAVVVSSGAAFITGERRRWHTLTLTFVGPALAEGGTPNPFRDYRLDVTLEHAVSGRTLVVPGFFADDGGLWRARVTLPEIGTWTYQASFRTGSDVAISPDPLAGSPLAFDGGRGSLELVETDKAGRDFRGRGRLEYVGERYLRFAGDGRYFLKAGADSPENFLGYFEFDNTQDNGGAANDLTDGLHRYAPHVADWRPGDPTWQGGRGKGIIGALNYLASTGANSVYFLTMNAEGDGREVYPWTTYGADRTRFDVSKLEQWEIVFSHMDALGIQLHVLLQETENDQLLDGGDLGLERRLYYREMVARFAHHLALEWNLGEETSRTEQQHRDDSQFLKGLDPYAHPIVLHTYPGQQEQQYAPLLGWPYLDGPSIQIDGNGNSHARTVEWVERSAAAGHAWVTCLDEQGPASAGVVPDVDDPTHDAMRRDVLWGNLMGGGAGVEWYFGYQFPHSDLDCEDWRSRAEMWRQTKVAVDFFARYLPFERMAPADGLVGAAAWCLASTDEIYAIYLPNGGTTDLDLSTASGTFAVRWFDPLAAGPLQVGTVAEVSGGGVVGLGDAPAAVGSDWAALVFRPTSLHRGVVAALSSGWRGSSLPLTSASDDETPPFPVAATSPGVESDALAAGAPLILYRLLGPGDTPTGSILKAVKRPGAVELVF